MGKGTLLQALGDCAAHSRYLQQHVLYCWIVATWNILDLRRNAVHSARACSSQSSGFMPGSPSGPCIRVSGTGPEDGREGCIRAGVSAIVSAHAEGTALTSMSPTASLHGWQFSCLLTFGQCPWKWPDAVYCSYLCCINMDTDIASAKGAEAKKHA